MKYLGILILGLVLSTPLFAETEVQVKASIDVRQDNQQSRIADGIKDGSLTSKEVVKLETKEANLENQQKVAEADGKVTKKEKKKLHKKANHISKDIHKQKHDKQKQ